MKKPYILAFIITVIVSSLCMSWYFKSVNFLAEKSGVSVAAKPFVVKVLILPMSVDPNVKERLSESGYFCLNIPSNVVSVGGLRFNYESYFPNTDVVSQPILEEIYFAAVTNVKSKIEDTDLLATSSIVSTRATLEKIPVFFTHPNLTIVDTTADVYAALDLDRTLVGLVLFTELSPQYRALTVDGISPFDFDADYPLRSYLITDRSMPLSFDPLTNRDPEKLLTVTQTGVTAITRSLAAKIERVGQYDWPSQRIAEYLRASDIAHTSNEVSFVTDCSPVDSPTYRFCSHPNYVESLTNAGIDIVELTGNHNNDYGSSWNAFSIDMYDNLGIKHFGGGKDAVSASEILYIEEKGTKIAFIGYNFYDWYYGNSYALATDSHPGANAYESDENMRQDIGEASENADIVIVDFQFQECWCYDGLSSCYLPVGIPNQRYYFELAADYGADIVVGTQAHTPQVIENYQDSVIFYGLGNIFFDQANWQWTREAMIITHVFYEGQHLSTVVHPIYYEGASMQPEILWEGSHRESLMDRYFQR
ncbi:CapA family protein [Candidatus Dojkabacteria bacterium]|nr:CapA family protein [Candidatus Dojkabacteria bacterium]